MGMCIGRELKLITRVCIVFLLGVLLMGTATVGVPHALDYQSEVTPIEIFEVAEEYISIENDDDWITQGWPGNGSISSPFLIENLEIAYLEITSSTSHFVIRNCIVTSYFIIENSSNGTVEDVDVGGYGLEFKGVQDIFIQNVTSGNRDGYLGIEILDANNITIQQSIFSGLDTIGLNLVDCSNVLIQDNGFTEIGSFDYATPVQQLVYDNQYISEFRSNQLVSWVEGVSIELDNCSNVRVTENEITDNFGSGIIVRDSTNVSIDSNSESQNMDNGGISTSDSYGVNISNNSIEGGISISNCVGTRLSNNNIGVKGLEIDGEIPAHFLIDEFNNNIHGTLLFYLSNSNNQSFDYEEFGHVYVVNCKEISFRNSAIIGGLGSFKIRNSSFLLFDSVDFSTISIVRSHYWILSNSIITQGLGIEIHESMNFQIVNNDISNTTIGISIMGPSIGVRIANNTFNDVLEYGLDLYNVNNATIENNTITNCAEILIITHIGYSEWMRVAVILNVYNSLIVNNTITDNQGHGISLGGENNTLFGNIIAGNAGTNAFDIGNNNQWDDGVSLGNYWGDYVGFGYYYISGLAESVDRFPHQAPGYEFSILPTILSISVTVIAVISFIGIVTYKIVKRQRASG